jgi:nucleotide-binding universal stress UspA family protein
VSYKTIVVHLDASKRRRTRLDLACTLARKYAAHLIGLFALPTEPPPLAPEPPGVLYIDWLNARRLAAEEAAQEFAERMRERQYTAKSEWHAALSDGFEVTQFYARHADLLVAGQPDPEGGGVPASFSHDLVMTAGRPVLYVPFAGHFEDCGSRVLVAWNASREAARAVMDALPFLRAADGVEVVTFEADQAPGRTAGEPLPDMGPYLLRHGAKARAITLPIAGIDVGSAILSRAADDGADLLVMGAYSHSRVRELVLGGATRTVFKSMTVPTLMSH